ncbi:MAG: hypothetical protein NZM06_11750 [Chloroherpetonaceae bacterium]|nr:hypothetical protein [Chloroherpetonaceae bacterium]MDW8438002.1 hypothetical protein [Chloroherpetonaceae bacterium]
MTKSRFFIAVLFLSILCEPLSAGNPSPFMRYLPRRGDIAIAARGGLLFANDTFIGHTTLAYGLLNGVALNGHIGFGQNPYETYFGGDLRITLFANRSVGFDAYFGGHAGGVGSGLDFGGILDFNLGRIGFITGIDGDHIMRGASATPINFFAGIDLGLSRSARFGVVAGFALTRSATSEITAGVNLYF